LENALVYVTDLGLAITDGDGLFRISGAQEGKSYKLSLRRDGVIFPAGDLTGSSNQFVEVIGTVDENFNPKQCAAKDISHSIFNSARFAGMLREKVAEQSILLASRGSRFDQKARKQLNFYLASSTTIPSIILDCSRIQECVTDDFTSRRMMLIERLGDLRRLNLLVNRELRKSGKKSIRDSKTFGRKVIRIHRNGVKAVGKISRHGGVCSSAALQSSVT
jgi:hypothetical protein